jgi:predicted phosphate transport protein (TIGR00153 family)
MVLRRLRVIPREERFFDMFNRSADTVLEGATLLLDILENYTDVERKVRRLRDIEHDGDEITHQIFRALNRTFVTPLDREDISLLATRLDDVLDWVEEIGRRLRIYKIDQPTELSRRFGRVILDQARAIQRAVPLLERIKDAEGIQRSIVEIHRLENEADDILVEALAGLYDDATDIPSLVRSMRWSDIYELLEEATDKSEGVAIALENIVVKNA